MFWLRTLLYMESLIREQELHLGYVTRCDRLLRHAILMAGVIGVVLILITEYALVNYDTMFVVIGFIIGFALPILYYNIRASGERRRFLKALEQAKAAE